MNSGRTADELTSGRIVEELLTKKTNADELWTNGGRKEQIVDELGTRTRRQFFAQFRSCLRIVFVHN